MVRLLGTGVWSRRKHEPQHHHAYIHPGSKQRSQWLKIRDGMHDCGHKGALLGAVEIPNTWYEPHSYPLDFRGLDMGCRVLWRPLELPQPAVPIMDWYVVEVAGLDKGDEAQGRAIFDAYYSQGALGYRWVLCKVQEKDRSGHSIRHSRYQVELLFKSMHAQGEAALSIRREFPEMLVDETSCIGRIWLGLICLTYLLIGFMWPPCSIAPRQLAAGRSPPRLRLHLQSRQLDLMACHLESVQMPNALI